MMYRLKGCAEASEGMQGGRLGTGEIAEGARGLCPSRMPLMNATSSVKSCLILRSSVALFMGRYQQCRFKISHDCCQHSSKRCGGSLRKLLLTHPVSWKTMLPVCNGWQDGP
jgi:hypothetical protein